jgi:6-phosphogluconolactonase
MPLEIQTYATEAAVADAAAEWLATAARSAIAARGQFLVAVSGGKTPWMMLGRLVRHDLPWDRIHLFQVDERIAPTGDPDRNLTHLQASLEGLLSDVHPHIHAMPVELTHPDAAAAAYSKTLRQIAGETGVLDVVHLGLGTDGHTASLVPDDPVLTVQDRDVAVTEIYQGRRRLTITYPVIQRARQRLWLATGVSKIPMLQRLWSSDPAIPAGCITTTDSVLLTDQDAAVITETP